MENHTGGFFQEAEKAMKCMENRMHLYGKPYAKCVENHTLTNKELIKGTNQATFARF